MITRLELRIAALALTRDIARKDKTKIEKDINFINLYFVTLIRYSTKGILIAIDAAVIFLFPLTPFTLVRLKYSVLE